MAGNASKEQLEEKYLKQLCARLYPEAMKKLPAVVESSNLDDWMERVLNVIIEQELQKQKLVPKDNTDNTNQNNINSNNKTFSAAVTTADKNSTGDHNDSPDLTEGQVKINSHHNSNSNTLNRTDDSASGEKLASETSSNSCKKFVSFIKKRAEGSTFIPC